MEKKKIEIVRKEGEKKILRQDSW